MSACVCTLCCVWLFVTPWTVAHQASLSIEFSRQEYWSGWKWKWKSLSRVQLCDPMDYTVHGILQARILEWVTFPFRGSSWSRSWTGVSCVAGGLFTNWTGVGRQPPPSLRDPPTQVSDLGLLHCRRNLYWLNHQAGPVSCNYGQLRFSFPLCKLSTWQVLGRIWEMTYKLLG